MSSRVCFVALWALPPVRGSHARYVWCKTHRLHSAAPLVRRVGTMAAADGKSRKSAEESNAISDTVKAGVERGIAERSIAAVQRASYSNDAAVSDFLPWEDAESVARSVNRNMPHARVAVLGGVDEPERAVLACAAQRAHQDDDALLANAKEHLAAVAMRGDLQRAKVSQRDLLGAVLAHISRERVGDVLLGEDGAGYAIVHSEIAEYLASVMTSVARVSVVSEAVQLEDVAARERKMKEFTSVEKSLRLDAVGSAGFGMSRTKMADGIRRGNVRVNQREVKTVAKNVSSGDKISFRGFGRVEIVDVETTRKGNMRIQIRRFL